MRTLRDRIVEAEEAIGRAPPPAPSTPEQARSQLTGYLRDQCPVASSTMTLVDRLVILAQTNPRMMRVEALAEEARTSVRSLHRLFERYVGVSSKWIVRRARVQDAAERVARGERVDWASIALELGYTDQSHPIRDFRAQVGQTPRAYASNCLARLRNPSTGTKD